MYTAPAASLYAPQREKSPAAFAAIITTIQNTPFRSSHEWMSLHWREASPSCLPRWRHCARFEDINIFIAALFPLWALCFCRNYRAADIAFCSFFYALAAIFDNIFFRASLHIERGCSLYTLGSRVEKSHERCRFSID